MLVILQVIFAGTKDNELNELLQLSKGCTLQHTANKIKYRETYKIKVMINKGDYEKLPFCTLYQIVKSSVTWY